MSIPHSLKIPLLVLLLTGCASQSRYSCNQFPTSGCQPVSAVYDSTDQGLEDYRLD